MTCTSACYLRAYDLTNQQGYYKAVFVYKGKEKMSTFFPDTMNEATLVKTIKEAYFNRIKEQSKGFIGQTKDGIKIQFWFEKNKKRESIF